MQKAGVQNAQTVERLFRCKRKRKLESHVLYFMHWSGLPKISLHKMHTHVYISFSRESDYSISPMITLSAFSYKNALRIKHRDNERVYFSSSKLCSAIKRSSYKTLRRDCLLKGQSLKFPTQVQRWPTQLKNIYQLLKYISAAQMARHKSKTPRRT